MDISCRRAADEFKTIMALSLFIIKLLHLDLPHHHFAVLQWYIPVCLVERIFPLNLSPKSHNIFLKSIKKLFAKSFIIVVSYYSYKLVRKFFLYFYIPFFVKARNLGEKPFKIHFLRRICAVYCSVLLAIGAGEGG